MLEKEVCDFGDIIPEEENCRGVCPIFFNQFGISKKVTETEDVSGGKSVPTVRINKTQVRVFQKDTIRLYKIKKNLLTERNYIY